MELDYMDTPHHSHGFMGGRMAIDERALVAELKNTTDDDRRTELQAKLDHIHAALFRTLRSEDLVVALLHRKDSFWLEKALDDEDEDWSYTDHLIGSSHLLMGFVREAANPDASEFPEGLNWMSLVKS